MDKLTMKEVGLDFDAKKIREIAGQYIELKNKVNGLEYDLSVANKKNSDLAMQLSGQKQFVTMFKEENKRLKLDNRLSYEQIEKEKHSHRLHQELAGDLTKREEGCERMREQLDKEKVDVEIMKGNALSTIAVAEMELTKKHNKQLMDILWNLSNNPPQLSHISEISDTIQYPLASRKAKNSV